MYLSKGKCDDLKTITMCFCVQGQCDDSKIMSKCVDM